MAKTVTEIEQIIYAKIAEYPELTSLNSASQVAVFKRWVYIVAYMTNYIWQILDTFKVEVEEIVKKGVAGRGDWYVSKAYGVRLGDNLVIVDNVLQYAAVDLTKRIIKRASFQNDTSQNPPVIKLRVATENSEGKIIGLSPTQITAFSDYIQSVMFAGTRIDIISQDTDLLKLVATIYYNPLFDVSLLRANVEAAINNYLKNLPFDGLVRVSSLVDAIQRVEGVVDVAISDIKAKPNLGVYADVVRVYSTVAGYIEIDADNFPLSNTLTYLPE